MSRTDDLRLRRFFVRRLCVAAERLRGRGISFFPLGGEDDGTWWYHPVSPEVPVFHELGDAKDSLGDLRALWVQQGLPELAELVGPLLALRKITELNEAQSSEVSDLIYPMY